MSYETEFSEEYRGLLGKIEEHFTVTLLDRIKLSIQLGSNCGFNNYKLLSVGFNKNDTQVIFTEASFSERPKLSIKHFKVDFSSMSLLVAFSISDIVIDADFELITHVLGTQFTQNGKIRFSMRNIGVEGRVGFFIEEDSFMTTNYNVNYTIEKIETEMLALNNEGEGSKVMVNYIEPTVTDIFKVEIRDRLDCFLDKFIGECVVDYSMSELLVDEPEEVIQFEAKRIKIGQDVFDEYLARLRGIFQDKPELARGEELRVCLKKGRNSCTVKSACARMRRLDTLRTKTSVSILENECEMVYYGMVEFSELEYVFNDCEIAFANATRKGELVVDAQQNKLLMRVTVPKNGGKVVVELEFVDMYQLRTNTDTSTVKLDDMEWLTDKLHPFLLGHARYYSSINVKKAVAILNAQLSNE